QQTVRVSSTSSAQLTQFHIFILQLRQFSCAVMARQEHRWRWPENDRTNQLNIDCVKISLSVRLVVWTKDGHLYRMRAFVPRLSIDGRHDAGCWTHLNRMENLRISDDGPLMIENLPVCTGAPPDGGAAGNAISLNQRVR